VAPRVPLVVLFMHHRDDALTRRHLALLRRANPGAAIVPLADEPASSVPGTIDVSAWPSPWDTRDKWRSCDAMIYRWFAHRTVEAERYVVLEYDCRVDVDLRVFYEAYSTDVVVGRWRLPERDASWHWFGQVARLDPEDRPFAAGVTPVAGLALTHAALEALCAHVTPRDVFCELRLGTAIRKAGLSVSELAGVARTRVDFREHPGLIVRPGFYHAVKRLDHNRHLVMRRTAAALRRVWPAGERVVRRLVHKLGLA